MGAEGAAASGIKAGVENVYFSESSGKEEIGESGEISAGKENQFIPIILHHISIVGSRTGALALGSGGNSPTFVVALSPVTIATFPVPAASNAACGFPALRFLDSFLLKFM